MDIQLLQQQRMDVHAHNMQQFQHQQQQQLELQEREREPKENDALRLQDELCRGDAIQSQQENRHHEQQQQQQQQQSPTVLSTPLPLSSTTLPNHNHSHHDVDLFMGMRALGNINEFSHQYLNPLREPRWAHEQRLLNLMDENTALAMYTAYSDGDTWVNSDHDHRSGEKALCGSLLPKFYYQQEIERTVNQWIEEERKHVELSTKSNSVRSGRSNSSTVSYCDYALSTASNSSSRTASSSSSVPKSSRRHTTIPTQNTQRLRRASVNAISPSQLPEDATLRTSDRGLLARATSDPTRKIHRQLR
jgi:hypothetical protein